MRPTFTEIAHGSAQYRMEVELRDRILRAPLGLTFSEEELALEASSFHLGSFLEDRLVGCLVLTPLAESKIKMRQVAIDPEVQGQGLGSKLVRYSEEFACAKGASLMVLNARQTAVNFYLRLGYRIVGDQFEEVTILHFKMEKNLR